MLDLKKLKILREQTGISISLCKKALEETDNNIEQAKKILSKWGIEKVKDKEKRSTAQGAIFSYVHHNHQIVAVVELLCETDFVAKNHEFIHLGTELAMQVASLHPTDVKELLNQEYIRDPKIKVADLIKDAILKFGENIKISRFIHWELGI